MEAALTFGSLGDILALGQLIIQLVEAIGVGSRDAGGSAREYKDLQRELSEFGRVLLQVVATYEQCGHSVYLNELDNATRAVVDECAGLIAGALEHFGGRYHVSLQPGGSESWLRDARKKVSWFLRERERVNELREKLNRNIQRLTLLNGLAIRKSARVDNATMRARIDEVHHLVSAHVDNYQDLIRLLREQRCTLKNQADQLRTANTQLAAQSGTLSDILAGVKQSLAAAREIKHSLAEVAAFVANFQVYVSSTMSLYALNPTKELPVTIEDPLGRHLTIPPELTDCLQWSTFQSILEDRFRGFKGYDRVSMRLYTLEEACTGRDIDRLKPLVCSLRRGMRVNMSMVFENPSRENRYACPRCGATVSDAKEKTRQCTTEGCGMQLQVCSRDTVDFLNTWDIDVNNKTAAVNSQAHNSTPTDFVRVRFHVFDLYGHHNLDDYQMVLEWWEKSRIMTALQDYPSKTSPLDYQMQLVLLEGQNRKRLMMLREEQDRGYQHATR
ncbi:hypothetical protein VTJ49DRAFT_6965 [Mycothermus thermophilus]|uniref:Ubiquitin-like domain-containing protein n=1 Tax=Humicola insolens TaxID=85995 RepID=A0ABR3VIG6_HUMIN